MKKKYHANPAKYLAYNRAKKRGSKIGDPPHIGNCPICKKQAMLYYDHDHKTNKFRGWICGQCNAGIGHFHDDPEVLRMAAFYLMWNTGMSTPFADTPETQQVLKQLTLLKQATA